MTGKTKRPIVLEFFALPQTDQFSTISHHPNVHQQFRNMDLSTGNDSTTTERITPSKPCLANLPPELRLQIYSYATRNFRQIYDINLWDMSMSKMPRTSPVPSLLAVSKEVRGEVLEVLHVPSDGAYSVRIDTSTIATNVPLEFATEFPKRPSDLRQGRVDATRLLLPNRKGVSITIEICLPSERTPDTFIRTRLNVDRVINWLNRSKISTLPKLQVEIDTTSYPDGCPCTYSDFAILMGPLTKLQKTCTNVILILPKWLDYFTHPKVECHIDCFRDILNDTSFNEKRKGIFYEQAILDIKLSLLLYKKQFSWRCWRSAPTTRALDSLSFEALNCGIKALQEWCAEYSEDEPPWLDRVDLSVWMGGEMSKWARESFDDAFEGRERVLWFWCAGLGKVGV